MRFECGICAFSMILINHIFVCFFFRTNSCALNNVECKDRFHTYTHMLTAHVNILFINCYTHQSMKFEMVCYRFSRYLNHFRCYAASSMWQKLKHKTAELCDKKYSVHFLNTYLSEPPLLVHYCEFSAFFFSSSAICMLSRFVDEKLKDATNMTFCHFSSRKTTLYAVYDSFDFFPLFFFSFLSFFSTYSKVTFFQLHFWERKNRLVWVRNAKKKKNNLSID